MKLQTLILVAFILVFISCNKENEIKIFNKRILNGVVQKGPYLNGTIITIFELNSDLSQTGKVYTTQIESSNGFFSINNLSLTSPYVLLQANGFYFNEVLGTNSSSQFQLSAISDLTDSSTINLNVFSTLERKRVEYLVAIGKPFKDSKIQAESEILRIFNFDKSNILFPEYLDIVKEGEDNAILLAMSAILQGYRTEAELSELLANITDDIKTDGQLNNLSLGTLLINHAKALKLNNVRNNLQDKFTTNDNKLEVSDFEKYVKLFIDSTLFEYTDLIQYPDSGKSGYNLLMYGKTDFIEQVNNKPYDGTFNLNITAIVPKLAQVKILIKFNNDNTWEIDPTNSGWIVEFNWKEPNVFIFTKDNTRELLDLKINLINTGTATIEIFENGLDVPTRVKNIKW